MIWTILGFTIVVLASLLYAAAGAGSQPGEDPQKKLEEAVWAKLKKDKLDEDVSQVLVKDSVVTFRGKPKNAYSKMKAIEAALSVEGVAEVESDLEVAEPESVDDFAKDLVNRVLSYPHYTVFDDVTFLLEDKGAVTLGGYVTMPFKKDELEERVGKVRGVRELKSQIQVLPASPSDDQLRQNLFQRICGSEMFEGYAQQAHPPIHIIVERGNVTLTGAVRSNVEKRQAESIVRSTFGVLQVRIEGLKDVGYGMGWFIGTYRGLAVSHHGGGRVGFGADVWLFPERKLGVVMLQNLDYREGPRRSLIPLRFADHYLGIQRGGDEEFGANAPAPRAVSARPPECASQGSGEFPAALERHAGRYHSDIVGDVEVRFERRGLTLVFEPGSIAALVPDAQGRIQRLLAGPRGQSDTRAIHARRSGAAAGFTMSLEGAGEAGELRFERIQ